MLRAVLSAALALALGAAGALAATTRVDEFHDMKGGPYADVNYHAASGEANRLTLAPSGPTQWTFEDPEAQITPGTRCSGGEHLVTCAPQGDARFLFVYLLDGDDELTVRSSPQARAGSVQGSGGHGNDVLRATGEPGYPFASLDGGAGDDSLSSTRGGTLSGVDGSDTLTGSDLNDGLSGGPGSDLLTAGAGNDSLSPGIDTDTDVVDGGPGRDSVGYGSAEPGETQPVTIDLGAGTAVPGDELRSIEDARGGNGPDVLRGSIRGDGLIGGTGNDTIDGRGGDDGLDGSDGDDRIRGGPGDDRVAGSDGRDDLAGGPGDDFLDPWRLDFRDDHETVSCGTGRDVLLLPEVFREIPGRFRPAPADCELLEAEYSGLGRFGPRPRIGRGTVSWSLHCARAVWKGRCPVTFLLRAGGRSVGSGTLDLRKGGRGRLVAALNEAGRRRARRGGPLEVGIRMKSDFASYAFGRVHRFEVTLPGEG